MADVKFEKGEVEIDIGLTNVKIFKSEEGLAFSLSKYIAYLSQKFVEEKGTFTIVLSGDDLITHMRDLLEEPYVNLIDWSKWYVFWVDERVVPKTSRLSNYRLDYDYFLSKVPILPDHIISINDKLSAVGAAADYENQLKQLVESGVITLSTPTASGGEYPSFDIMLLGMGYNGHVASLFPDHPQQEDSRKWVTYITDSPKPPPQRITMTFPVIDSSRNVAIVVNGSSKAETVKVAFDNSPSSSHLLPVDMVSSQGGLLWFLDIAAASLLLI